MSWRRRSSRPALFIEGFVWYFADFVGYIGDYFLAGFVFVYRIDVKLDEECIVIEEQFFMVVF